MICKTLKPKPLHSPSVIAKESVPLASITFASNIASSFRMSPSLNEKIDVLWDQSVSEAEQQGKRIWNSNLYRLESYSRQSSSILFSLSLIETKQVLATYQDRKLIDSDEVCWPKNLFVASIVLSSDEKALFGQLSGKTLGRAGKIDLIGGALSHDESTLGAGIDIRRALVKELEEEMGITDRDVLEMRYRGLVLTERLSIGIILETVLEKTALEVQEAFLKRNDGELSSVMAIPASTLIEHLEKSESYLPAVAELFRKSSPMPQGEHT